MIAGLAAVETKAGQATTACVTRHTKGLIDSSLVR